MAIIDGLQRRFIRMLGYRYRETPIATLENQFNLQPLSLRRKRHDLLFLFNIVNGQIDCPELLSLVNLNIPRGTRCKSVFVRKFVPTSYALNQGMSRLQRAGAKASSSNVDFFSPSIKSLKREVNDFLNTHTTMFSA